MTYGLPLFDATESQRRKAEGMERAANAKTPMLGLARALAERIARQSPHRECHADLVHAALIEDGRDPSELGNARGSIFQGDQWEFTGRWHMSERQQSHQNPQRVWKLKQ